MRVALTHEQADFDALASLFGVFLLDEAVLPVLPRRLNRNLRAFITLYGAEFPFVDPRDLFQTKIEGVTLVDTQSLITLKGMNNKTHVQVIDHHPRRKGLPKSWDVTIVETGATTTYFVEALQDRGEPLSAIHASLLLLGIYEDTGTLTYEGTTPRDVRAVAYLLEHGASLRVASDFLNPPLSDEQRKVYDQLVDSAEILQMNGHRIVLTCGIVETMTEEISTLAHKLRDFFDPDALFVLVLTSEGVRLVARSTSDQIDVSAIAANFKGGGHERASAALIRPTDGGQEGQEFLNNVREEFMKVLPRFVQPSITVAQIMSKRPRTLSPETNVVDASAMMQRYGYEGFPVVKQGKVIGLLTRRAVDRAIAHKLNLTADSLMDAGDVTVNPEDSLQQLQFIMTDSGWGQVPVIDPKSGEVIGIVTRTDLIKTLSLSPAMPTRKNLSSRLEKALPSRRFALLKAIAKEASLMRMPLYIVGGFVRDLLLDRPSLDFDIVVEGDAIALAKSSSSRYGGRVTSHTRFGTAKWYLAGSKFGNGESKHSLQNKINNKAKGDDETPNPEFLDFISARLEFYERPTALPIVERGSIKLDLHRRDFTINTLAIRLDGHHFGELHDYWGGFADLQRGIVRVLHSLSFVDDPTRMLRAVRFEQRFGFNIEQRTLQLIDEAHELISRLSDDRIRHELDLILDEPHVAAMFSRLSELGLLKAIHPSLTWNDGIKSRFEKVLSAEIPDEWSRELVISGVTLRRAMGYILLTMDLGPKQVETVEKRLRFPVTLRKVIRAANKLRIDLPGLKKEKPSVWVNRLEDIPYLSIYAIINTADSDDTQGLRDYFSRWRHIKPQIDGHDLRRLGLPPGPRYQKILNRIRSAWLDGEVSSPDQEKKLLKGLTEEA